MRSLLGGGRWQETRGLPLYPGKHEHDGAWLETWHSALSPQVPGHGSRHLLLTHARSRGQSVLRTHSGLHPVYGSPWYSGKHTQEPAPFRSLHTAFAPHGDGLQGSRSSSIGSTAIRRRSCNTCEITCEWQWKEGPGKTFHIFKRMSQEFFLNFYVPSSKWISRVTNYNILHQR